MVTYELRHAGYNWMDSNGDADTCRAASDLKSQRF